MADLQDKPTIVGVAYPDNVAMRCLLEEMRDNPGVISVSAARGAVMWALGRIQTLESLLQSDIPRIGDQPHAE